MEYDVIIVGGGPAGLAAAIRLKQLEHLHQRPISVCLLEKGAQIGSHILSGAILDPRGLQHLLPHTWQTAPLHTPVKKDLFYWLIRHYAMRLPTPKPMQNKGHYIIQLGELCSFLARQAEQLGCELYPGFAANRLLFEDNRITGVQTGDVGLDQKGQPKPQYQPGMVLKATVTLFAEGCRGQLSEQLMQHYHLRAGKNPQTYGLGIKELWQLKNPIYPAGTVIHTIGWPLDHKTYGGSFLYFLNDNLLSIGLVVGLDYQNPYLSPFEEFQRFKTHPFITSLLIGGERIAYGARAVNEGGYQSIPTLIFPGGALIGDSAGFLNVPQIKGIHNAIESGILAADACYQALLTSSPTLDAYPQALEKTWVMKELFTARNIRPGFQRGLIPGLINAAFEIYMTQGKSPWTLQHKADYLQLKPKTKVKPIVYPKPDGQITFDRLSSVYLTNTFHEENQPCHLKLRHPTWAIEINDQIFASPESRYCPAAVYEIVEIAGKRHLQIHAQNCIHCKTCDIKDPKQNIIWTAPEGGGGPNYTGM